MEALNYLEKIIEHNREVNAELELRLVDVRRLVEEPASSTTQRYTVSLLVAGAPRVESPRMPRL